MILTQSNILRTTDLRKYIFECWHLGGKRHFGALTDLKEVSPERETPDEGNEVVGNLGRISRGAEATYKEMHRNAQQSPALVEPCVLPSCELFGQNMLEDPFWSGITGMF